MNDRTRAILSLAKGKIAVASDGGLHILSGGEMPTEEEIAAEIQRLSAQKFLFVKTRAKSNINTECAKEITKGFIVGDRLYQSAETDQINLLSAIIAGGDMDYACFIDGQKLYVAHTIAELRNVFREFNIYREALLRRAYTLKAQIDIAADEASVSAIVW